MRNAILAMILASTLLTGELYAAEIVAGPRPNKDSETGSIRIVPAMALTPRRSHR